jgi:hypothetical protein
MNWQAKQIVFLNNVVPLKREWVDLAACKNATVDFFPKDDNKTNLEDTRARANTPIKIQRQMRIASKALELCANCPVQRECRVDHLHEVYGVWWGTVPAERDRTYHANCSCMSCITRRVSRDGRKRARKKLVCTAAPEQETRQSNTG